ncbi:MAG: T9SS type A sorting domain-containing protein [Bacteroidota bacterium]
MKKIFTLSSFKIISALSLAVASLNYSHAQVLASWDMNSIATYPGGVNNFGPSPAAPNSTNANVVVGGLTRGTGVGTTGTGAARGFGGNGWTQTTDAATAIAANQFITFTVQPLSTNTYISIAGITTFNYRRSGTGPSTALVQYSINGGTFIDIATVSFTSTATTGASLSAGDLASLNTSTVTAMQGINDATVVTFRIVPLGSTGTAGTFYIFDFGNSTTADFVLSASSLILPLNVVEFTASKTNNGNLVSWTTSNEVNVQSIVLERSADGRSFSQLASFIAGSASYTFTDATPLNGANYYRLKIVDKNGTFKLSKVVAVMKGGKGAAITGIYPTITTGGLTLSVAAAATQKLQLIFTDLQGRIAAVKNISVTTGNNTLNLDISTVSNGMYLVKVLQNDNEATSFKIIKQ